MGKGREQPAMGTACIAGHRYRLGWRDWMVRRELVACSVIAFRYALTGFLSRSIWAVVGLLSVSCLQEKSSIREQREENLFFWCPSVKPEAFAEKDSGQK